MMPAAFAGVEAQILIWFASMLRPGAAFLAAPVFGATAVPLQVRLILALAVGMPSAALVQPGLPPAGMVSLAGLVLVMGEIVLGLAFGLALQIGFAAALIAGEVIGNAMGLGFASMQDPTSGHSSTAVGQLFNMLATALFLACGGHLALIEIIVASFRALPPGAAWLSAPALRGLIDCGGLMFAAGATVALPVAAALVLVQIAMGTITRAAPALNLFAVGIPATVLAGIAAIAVAVPVMAGALDHAITLTLDLARRLAGF